MSGFVCCLEKITKSSVALLALLVLICTKSRLLPDPVLLFMAEAGGGVVLFLFKFCFVLFCFLLVFAIFVLFSVVWGKLPLGAELRSRPFKTAEEQVAAMFNGRATCPFSSSRQPGGRTSLTSWSQGRSHAFLKRRGLPQ